MATNPLTTFLQGYQSGNQMRQQDQMFDMRMKQAQREDQAASQEAEFAKLDRLGEYSRMLLKAPAQMRPGIYARIRADVATDFPGEYPEQWSDDLIPTVQQIADALDPAEQFTLSPGSARYGADGRLLVQQPFAPEKQEFQLSPDGTQWLPKPTGRQQAGDLGPTIADPGAQGFDSLYASVPGLRVTSGMRTPEQNKAAGGVANSFHLTGQAIDIGTPNPEQRAGINQWAAQNGYEVIDNYKDGHVHLEPRGRPAQAPSNGGAIPIPGANPRKTASFTMLSPEEAAQYGLTPGTVAQRNDETGQVSVVSKPDARAGTGVMPLSAGEAAKVRRDFKETKDALNTFKAFDQALADIPSGPGLLLDGNAQGRLGTSYNNARAALRILYNTGVLQPGELPMLESALRDPTSFLAVLDPRTRPQIQSQLDELYRTITRGIENQVTSYPQIFNQQRFDDFREQKAAPKSGNRPQLPPGFSWED